MITVVPQRSRGKSPLLIVLLLLLAVVGGVSYVGWRQSVPGPRVSVQAPRFLGHNNSFTVTFETARGNLKRAEVRVVQGGRSVTVAINDRGGFGGATCLDLTYGAFTQIANTDLGVIPVLTSDAQGMGQDLLLCMGHGHGNGQRDRAVHTN